MTTALKQHPTTARGDWRSRARCRDMNPEIWFPTGTAGPAVQQTEQAKAECRRCPVRDRCLQWALDSGLPYGVAGGLSEQERAAVRRRR